VKNIDKLIYLIPIMIFAWLQKYEVSMLIVISVQLMIITEKLGDKNGTTN
jgi:hypothetical protein